MRLVATERVAWSMCPSVGHVREPCINDWAEWDAVLGLVGVQTIQKREGEIWGVVPSIEKHCESLLRCTQPKKSATISERLLQPTALLPTGRYHINFSREKSASVMRPLVTILWLLITYCNKVWRSTFQRSKRIKANRCLLSDNGIDGEL